MEHSIDQLPAPWWRRFLGRTGARLVRNALSATAHLRDAKAFLALLDEQLAGTVKQSEVGASRVLNGMRAVHQISFRQSETIREAETNGHALMKVVQEKVAVDAQLAAILERFVQKQEEDHAAHLGRIKRLQGIKDLAPMVDAIGSVAQQTNFLAINAAVEAARAGERGRGFAVVAAEIRQLSHRTAVVALEIRQKITNATQGIEQDLQATADAASQQTGSGTMRRVLADIGDMQQRFAKSAEQLQLGRVLGDLRSGHEQIAQGLADAMGEVQVHDVTRQRIESVQLAMRELNDHLQTLAGAMDPNGSAPIGGATLQDRLRQMSERYVMDSQREVHRNVLGPAAGAAAAGAAAGVDVAGKEAPRIELF